jgi:hypothetical protein
MINSDITRALATLHINDMHRSADAWRAATNVRRGRAREHRDVTSRLRRKPGGWARRGQLGPAHNYVTR